MLMVKLSFLQICAKKRRPINSNSSCLCLPVHVAVTKYLAKLLAHMKYVPSVSGRMTYFNCTIPIKLAVLIRTPSWSHK